MSSLWFYIFGSESPENTELEIDNTEIRESLLLISGLIKYHRKRSNSFLFLMFVFVGIFLAFVSIDIIQKKEIISSRKSLQFMLDSVNLEKLRIPSRDTLYNSKDTLAYFPELIRSVYQMTSASEVDQQTLIYLAQVDKTLKKFQRLPNSLDNSFRIDSIEYTHSLSKWEVSFLFAGLQYIATMNNRIFEGEIDSKVRVLIRSLTNIEESSKYYDYDKPSYIGELALETLEESRYFSSTQWRQRLDQLWNRGDKPSHVGDPLQVQVSSPDDFGSFHIESLVRTNSLLQKSVSYFRKEAMILSQTIKANYYIKNESSIGSIQESRSSLDAIGQFNKNLSR